MGEVLIVIEKYFQSYDYKKGSHVVVTDSRITSGFPREGFTIPIKNGRKVIKHYLKRLMKALVVIGVIRK